MEQLKEIANKYKELFISSKERGNPYYFMMYTTIEKLIKDIENADKLEVEENNNLGL